MLQARKATLIATCALALSAGDANAQFSSSPPMAEQKFAKGNLVIIYNQSGTATGSIIGESNGTYLILTVKHAIDVPIGSEIDIETGSREKLQAKVIAIAKKADLALLKFKSRNCYPQAYLGVETALFAGKMTAQLQPSRMIAAGYSAVDPSVASRPVLRTAVASISVNIPIEDSKDGYMFGYDAPTARGMSGGALFTDAQNINPGSSCRGQCNNPYGYHLIVHGRGEADSLRGFAKTGYNFGIPAITGMGLAAKSGDLQAVNSKVLYVAADDPPSIERLEKDSGSWHKGFRYSNSCKPDGLIPVEVRDDSANKKLKSKLEHEISK
jgi:hypothetical protein